MTDRTKIEIATFFIKNHWTLLLIFILVQIVTGQVLSGEWTTPAGVSAEAIARIHALTGNLIAILTALLVFLRIFRRNPKKSPSSHPKE